jgi:hypothetical protein
MSTFDPRRAAHASCKNNTLRVLEPTPTWAANKSSRSCDCRKIYCLIYGFDYSLAWNLCTDESGKILWNAFLKNGPTNFMQQLWNCVKLDRANCNFSLTWQSRFYEFAGSCQPSQNIMQDYIWKFADHFKFLFSHVKFIMLFFLKTLLIFFSHFPTILLRFWIKQLISYL